jgi:hypothetical protein
MLDIVRFWFKVLLFLEFPSRFSHDPDWFKILIHPDLILSGLLKFQSQSILDPLPRQTKNLVLIFFKLRLGKKSWDTAFFPKKSNIAQSQKSMRRRLPQSVARNQSWKPKDLHDVYSSSSCRSSSSSISSMLF